MKPPVRSIFSTLAVTASIFSAAAASASAEGGNIGSSNLPVALQVVRGALGRAIKESV